MSAQVADLDRSGMVASYVESAWTGFLAFTGVGALVLLPLILLHYWRFGRVEPRRAFVLYGLLAYGLVALALIFLPFPDRAQVCQGEQMLSTVPFQWITDLRNNLAYHGRHGLGAVITSSAFVQQVFNVALFVPLGVILRKAYGRGAVSVVLIGAALSVAVEAAQYSGNFGYYPCPYRIADVDDLISNTAGALLGWIIAPAAAVVPRIPSPDDSTAPAGVVSLPRRLSGLVTDLVLVIVAGKVLPDPKWIVVPLVVIRVLLPAVAGGRTAGGYLLRYRILRSDGAPATWRVFVRELFGATGLVTYALLLSPLLNRGLDLLVVGAVLTGALVVPMFRRDQRGWHDQVAGTGTCLDVESEDRQPAWHR